MTRRERVQEFLAQTVVIILVLVFMAAGAAIYGGPA